MNRFGPRFILAALAGVSVIAVIAVAIIVLAGGSDDDSPSADEITARVLDAIDKPGMVYHTVGDDGSEVWLDFEGRVYRRHSPISGGYLVSVGEDWTRIAFDPFQNQVTIEDLAPTGDAVPRINNPAATWTDALAALAFGNQLNVIGRTTSDGRDVLAIEAASPVVRGDGGVTGTLLGRVELDPETYFPYSFENKEEYSDGTTPTPGVNGVPVNRRIIYTTAELVPRDSLASDFFDRKNVEDQVLTVEENIGQIRDLGLTPWWLGRQYDGPDGILVLPPTNNIFVVTSEERAEIHYAFAAPDAPVTEAPSLDTVRVRLATDPATFGPPPISEYGGTLPEQADEVTVRGGPATLYTSLLSRNDLPCDTPGGCPNSPVLLYRRLVFAIGETNIQIETEARIDTTSGAELNQYNTRDGIISLAEALTESTD